MSREAPTLRDVRRGQNADELVLITSENHAILVRGDGATPDETIRMADAALRLLRETLRLIGHPEARPG